MIDMEPIMNLWLSPLLHSLLVGLAGIVLWRFVPGRFATVRLIVQIVFFLAMTAMLLAEEVLPYERSGGEGTGIALIMLGSVKLIWWLHLAWALIGFVRIYLVFEGKPREGLLLQDLVVGVVYVGMLLSILAFVFAVPVGTLIATSGVFAIVIGLALQNTLSDVFSGVALKLGHPYIMGDWILLDDGTEGRVVESNWRSTHLLTQTNNVVALPNSSLAKIGLTNLSRPDESHWLSVKVRVVPTRMPAFVADAMRTVLMSCNLTLKEPPPLVAIRGLDAAAIELDLYFRVADVGHRIAASNEVFDLVYRHAKSTGIVLASPLSTSVTVGTESFEEMAAPPPVTPIELIRAIPIFSALTDDEQETLAATISVRTYQKGEVIARQGEMLPSLMIIRSGVVARQWGEGDARMQEVSRLSPGDFFGETGLLAGIGEISTLRAISQVVIYAINQESFAPLLANRPDLAEDLATILANGRAGLGGTSGPTHPHASAKSALLNAIRTIFGTMTLTRD